MKGRWWIKGKEDLLAHRGNCYGRITINEKTIRAVQQASRFLLDIKSREFILLGIRIKYPVSLPWRIIFI